VTQSPVEVDRDRIAAAQHDADRDKQSVEIRHLALKLQADVPWPSRVSR
jgi:hypothetical protein